jgi:hypothetical protein
LHLEAVVRDGEPNGQTVAGDDEGVVTGMPGQLSSLQVVGRYNLRVRE